MLEDLYSNNIVDIPDDIERVIEGGEDEQNVASGNESDKEEGKNSDDKDKDKTKIKRKLGPRPVLNAERLKGPRGIGIMESFFSNIKLKGKGREREDLDLVMGRLEHWSHRLFPRMQFDDSLKKIEKLGSKKEVVNYVKRIRLGMEEETGTGEVEMDDPPDSPPPLDPFDQLLSPSSVPARPAVNMEITAEQKERMLRNRLMAEERRAARIKKAEEMKKKYQAEHTNSQPENTEAKQIPGSLRGSGDHSEHMEVDQNLESDLVEEVINMDQRLKNQADVLAKSDENGKINQQVEVSGNPRCNLVVDALDVHERQCEKQPQPDVLTEINETVESNKKIEVYENRELNEEEIRFENPLNPIKALVTIEKNENELNTDSENKSCLLERFENQDSTKETNENPNDAKVETNINQNVVSLENHDQPSIPTEQNEIQSLAGTSVERNVNQNNVVMEGTHNQPDVVMEGTGNQPDVMEGPDNQPDVVMEGTGNQPDVVMEGTGNQPDVVRRRNVNQSYILDEGTISQPDVLAESIEHLPDILIQITEP